MINDKKVIAIIAAAGSSNRMKSNINKIFIKLDGKPVLMHTIEKFENAKYVDDIIIGSKEDEIDYLLNEVLPMGKISKVKAVIKGGKTRQKTVENCLSFLPDEDAIVLSHDGARPFIKIDIIEKAIEEVVEKRAVVVGVPVKDTIKTVEDEKSKVVFLTPNRNLLWRAQSPQIFYLKDLRAAYEYGRQEKIEVTDDSSIVEKYGIPVYMTMGSYDNIKLTTPEDLMLAELFMKSEETK